MRELFQAIIPGPAQFAQEKIIIKSLGIGLATGETLILAAGTPGQRVEDRCMDEDGGPCHHDRHADIHRPHQAHPHLGPGEYRHGITDAVDRTEAGIQDHIKPRWGEAILIDPQADRDQGQYGNRRQHNYHRLYRPA